MHMEKDSVSETRSKKFLCQSCGKSLKTLAAVNLHTKVAHKEPTQPIERVAKFQCHICERKYQSTNSLKFHIRLAHESEPQKCPHCGKLTTSSVALIRYREKNSILYFLYEYKNITHEMHITHYWMPLFLLLSSHIKIVHQNEEFECHVCLKKLKSSTSFKEHVCK